ncbi:MAG: helix-turn-helix domain-containing protein [Rhodobacter sp.]|nr:helix-turn-helix domain-containing protein [Rhodobacter sp.]
MWSRQAFLDGETTLRELPAIGRSKQDAAVRGSLQPHDHPHAYEVVLVESGRLRWWVEDEELTLSSGMLFLTRPGETHGAVDRVLEPSEIRWAQFRLDIDAAFGLSAKTRTDLRATLNQANRTGRATEIHRYHLGALLLEHQRTDRRCDLVRAHSVCFLEATVSALSQTHSSTFDPRIAEALILMRGTLGQALSVPRIAAHVGLSESWFHQLFQRSTGLTVGDWLTRERIERAKSMLSDTTTTVTEIALDLGFSSSQYFATVFKKLTGQTPREFRQAAARHSTTLPATTPLRSVPYNPD